MHRSSVTGGSECRSLAGKWRNLLTNASLSSVFLLLPIVSFEPKASAFWTAVGPRLEAVGATNNINSVHKNGRLPLFSLTKLKVSAALVE